MIERPKILYKYLSSKGGLTMLSNHSLKYTPINELNDPFEFMPGGYDFSEEIDEHLTPRLYDSFYRLDYQKVVEECRARKITIPSKEEYSSGILAMANEFQTGVALQKSKDKLQDRRWDGFVEQASKRYGVLSLCEDFSNILMWSHYAEQHKGIVLGIDTSFFHILYKVKYSEDSVKLKLSFDSNEIDYNNAIVNLMTTKALPWAYEKEWRSIKKLEGLNKDEANNLYLDSTFSLNYVREIYFGARFDEEQLRVAVESFGPLKPQIYKMSCSQEHLSHEILILD